MQLCDVCELLEADKRSGVCATCLHNKTFANHLKVSKQVANVLKAMDKTLDDITKGPAATGPNN